MSPGNEINTRWETENRTLEKRARANAVNRVRELRARRRVDVILVIIVAVSLSCQAGSCFLLINWGDGLGWFDTPLIQPIKDERILVNVRDEITESPMLDAVMHQPDGRVYITQKGGTVHRYNPLTELWSTERPFSTTDVLLNLDLVRLRSGCGADPLSDWVNECSDPKSLWAISADDGLARRFRGEWELVISDTAFVGTDGTPVENSELTAVAVSPDGRWLVVGTKGDGVGIYNVERRLWMQREAVSGTLPSPSVTHVAWWKGRFWIGGPGGLSSLEMGDTVHTLIPIPVIGGKILDLDADPHDALWILELGDCDESGDNCLRLGKLLEPNGKLELLIDERNLFAELDMADLIFAQQWGNQLVLAGDSGIFSYDTEHHAWERHFDGRVVTTLPLKKGFFFGYVGGAGMIDEEGHVETWPIPNEQVVKLVHSTRGDLLAMTATGTVFSIDPTGTTDTVFGTDGTAFDPESFTAAAAVGDVVLLVGPEGALLHDVSTRGYRDISTRSLPDWLLVPQIQLISSGDHLYALSPWWNETTVYTLPGDRVTEANFGTDIRPVSIPVPVRRVRDWDGQGIGLIAGDDQVYRFTPGGGDMLSDPAAPAMEHRVFRDVAPLDRGLVVLTEDGLRYYDGDFRAWGDFLSTPVGDRAVEVDTLGSYILARTGQGRLVYFHEDNEPAQAVIGDETGFHITDSSLSDARSVGQHLYLAGEGWIERYNLDLRHIDERWALPTNSPVELKGIVDGRPLAISEHIATLGDTEIEANAGPVASLLESDGSVWTVRDHSGQRYLKQYSVDSSHKLRATRCFFRNPGSGSAVTQILDARTLPDRGTVVVATNVGLRFYDPKARSWFVGPTDLGPDGGRLYVLGKYLVLAEEYQEAGFHVSFIPIKSINIPDSCSNAPVSLRAVTVPVRALAIDEQAGRAAWIRPNGAVVEWQFQEDAEREILPPPVAGPASVDLKRVYDRPDDLLFTTDDSLWRYNLSRRRWSQMPLRLDPSAGLIADINVEEKEGLETVVARLETGEFYLGSFKPYTPTIQMSQIYTPVTASFDAPAEALLDVQDGTLWTFVLDDQIKYFDPAQRKWLPGVEFASPDRSRSYHRALERRVAAGEEGRVWWVARNIGDTPYRFARYEREAGEITALDGEGTIWKLARDGTLSQCPMPDDSDVDYICSQYSPQPFLLNPRDVRQAFRWQDIILFETAQGLRAFEPASGNEVTLPPTVANFTGVVIARSFGSHIWLHSRDRFLVLNKNRNNDVEAVSYDVEGSRLVSEYNIRNALQVALPVIFLAYLLATVIVSRKLGLPLWHLSSRAARGRASKWLILFYTAKKSKKLSILIGVGFVGLLFLVGLFVNQKIWSHRNGLVRNDWSRLQQNAVRLQDGRWAYDPVTTLSTNQEGALIAVRPSREVTLAPRGTVQLELPPALDADWLRWDRSLGSFVVASTSGRITISKDEFVADGHLLFEPVDAILAESPDRLHVANQHGIWTYNQSHLSLDGQAITYQPIQLHRPITAAHGRFLTSGGDLFLGEDHLRQAEPWSVIRFDVTISERVRGHGVTGTVTIGSIRIPAFGDRGFIWDMNRRGLAYAQDGLLLQSDAGIHPVQVFEDFDPGPNGLARQGGILHYEAGRGVFLLHGSTWYRRDPTGWTAEVESPVANRTLVHNTTWVWTLQNGQLDVNLSDPSHNFALSQTGRGYSFSSDRLVDVATHRNQLYVMTEAFLEIASRPGEIGSLTALRLPPSPTDRLEEIRFANGSTALFRRHRGAISRWDPFSQQFVPVSGSDNPYRRRPLIETDRLRFTSYPGRVAKELRVDDVSRGDGWVGFNLADEHFPFDVVTSVATHDNELYVGTAAGLQVYSDGLATGFNDVDHIYHLRGRAGGPLVAVSQVGVPRDDPELVMARSSAGCIEKRAGGTFAPCRDPSLLDWELRVQTDLWQWTLDPDGSIIGQYRTSDGGLEPGGISIVQGRFPHDHFQDVVVCNGQAFSMWRRNPGWITVYPDDTIRLNPGLRNYVLPDYTDRFICISHNVPLSGVTLSPGLYAEGYSQQIWQFSRTQWAEVTDSELVSGLVVYADRPPILDRKRLRLLPPRPGESHDFEQRTLDGQWLPLPWESGRVALDWWHELLVMGDQLWAATPVGLVAFSRDAKGQARLDADAVVVVREPVDRQGACEITDLSVENGTVLARCDADRAKVYQGHLDGQRDTGVFQLFNGPDPFAEQELISKKDTGYWQWRLTGREGGRRGSLVGTLHQEEIQLVGGRFDFDTVRSVALFETDLLEIGTEAYGWFRAPRASVHVRDLERPRVPKIDPTAVTGVGITRVGEEQRLCLLESGGSYVRLARDRAPEYIESCSEYLGDDGFWRYAKDGERLLITTPNSIGGAAMRHLEAGRFTDDVVTGLPVTGKDAGGVFYLLPTQAGVLRLDRYLRGVRIHAPPFAGLPEGFTPDVLFMLDFESPIYAGHSAFHHLDQVRQPVAELGFHAPQDAALQAVEDGPQDFIHIHWVVQGERVWDLVRRSDFAPLLRNNLLVNLSGFDTFDDNWTEWGEPEPWLELRFRPNGVDVLRLGSARPYRVDIPGEFDLVAPILFEERLLLIGEQELMDVNLEQAMFEVFALPPGPPIPKPAP